MSSLHLAEIPAVENFYEKEYVPHIPPGIKDKQLNHMVVQVFAATQSSRPITSWALLQRKTGLIMAQSVFVLKEYNATALTYLTIKTIQKIAQDICIKKYDTPLFTIEEELIKFVEDYSLAPENILHFSTLKLSKQVQKEAPDIADEIIPFIKKKLLPRRDNTSDVSIENQKDFAFSLHIAKIAVTAVKYFTKKKGAISQKDHTIHVGMLIVKNIRDDGLFSEQDFMLYQQLIPESVEAALLLYNKTSPRASVKTDLHRVSFTAPPPTSLPVSIATSYIEPPSFVKAALLKKAVDRVVFQMQRDLYVFDEISLSHKFVEGMCTAVQETQKIGLKQGIKGDPKLEIARYICEKALEIVESDAKKKGISDASEIIEKLKMRIPEEIKLLVKFAKQQRQPNSQFSPSKKAARTPVRNAHSAKKEIQALQHPIVKEDEGIAQMAAEAVQNRLTTQTLPQPEGQEVVRVINLSEIHKQSVMEAQKIAAENPQHSWTRQDKEALAVKICTILIKVLATGTNLFFGPAGAVASNILLGSLPYLPSVIAAMFALAQNPIFQRMGNRCHRLCCLRKQA